MKPMNFTRRRVLVTGASSGLGLEMARQLANRDQADLVLVARRLDRLNELKAELEGSTGIRCQVIAADLSKPQDVDRVFAEATAAGEIYGVILNAGVTHFGKHLDMEWSGFETMLATNVTSVVRLVNLFTPYLIGQGREGGIMLVSSMAGLLPVPFQDATSCARDGLAAMQSRQVIHVPGRLNRAQLFATRLTPRRLITRIAGVTYRKALKAGEAGQGKTA